MERLDQGVKELFYSLIRLTLSPFCWGGRVNSPYHPYPTPTELIQSRGYSLGVVGLTLNEQVSKWKPDVLDKFLAPTFEFWKQQTKVRAEH